MTRSRPDCGRRSFPRKRGSSRRSATRKRTTVSAIALAPVILFVSALVTPPPAAWGQSAPAADYRWAIRAMGGEEIRLERFRGEVLFINLWASWCRPCVAELASIERLRSTLEGVDGIRFLLISPEAEPRVREFLRRHPYRLPFYTEAQRMPPAFGLRALPTTYVVDRGGRVVLVHRGAADWDTARMREFLRRTASRSRHSRESGNPGFSAYAPGFPPSRE